jgi:outer membrane biosynthesis protein TonB
MKQSDKAADRHIGPTNRETSKTGPIATLIVVIVVILSAFATGMVIRNILIIRAARLSQAQPVPQPQAKTQPAQPTGIKADEPVPEPVHEEKVAVQEPNKPPPEEPAPTAAKEPNLVPEMKPAQPQPQFTQGFGNRGFGGPQPSWPNFNLSEQDQARLKEAFTSLWQRWQNLPPERQQAEAARWQGMMQRWQNMPDEERQQTMERVQGRFEEWRDSGGSAEELQGIFSLD